MAYATTDIINWMKISQPLARLGEAKRMYLTGKGIQSDLDLKLYVERKSIEWEYNQDPTSENLFQIANWGFALCGIYVFEAMLATGGGGVVATPSTPAASLISPLPISSDDFVDATNWEGQNSFAQPILSNYTLQVFWDDAQIFLEEGVGWTRTAAGVNIIVPGFDATANSYQFYIFVSA
jgi:hypothetical protein